ncbi:signal recognition particle subunit SRP14 [Geosmithia morbida]|uniref:Signal recognition particle subunit SRP14 n=1 Tax=Geosmithia morbida TaxID=1094350 RepID=A0A9P5D395_9HYPO|nr:signal recognition particle subunit SRP14 [Geosmithia morbida]KAF4121565.1 signal recognition particle subunit SRP14 [Geosmithia morbida]
MPSHSPVSQSEVNTYSLDTSVSSPDDHFPDLHPSEPLSLVIRASNGKSKRNRSDKINVSTIVKPDELEVFYARYADVCKAGMTALKPRDRSRKKEKAKAKKKKAVA